MSKQVAETILVQLGGNKFIAMTGATQLGYDDNALNMKLGSGTTNKATHLRIALDPMTDTYRMEFLRLNKGNARKCIPISVDKLPPIYGLHADDLQRVFTEQTGMRTSL